MVRERQAREMNNSSGIETFIRLGHSLRNESRQPGTMITKPITTGSHLSPGTCECAAPKATMTPCLREEAKSYSVERCRTKRES